VSTVQVAVEPTLPHQLPALEAGLQLLNRADAFVQVSLSEASGEWLLGAAGEVHLETCLKDLRERFAGVELRVSPPLVSFKESVAHPAEVPADAVAGIHSFMHPFGALHILAAKTLLGSFHSE
jgi:ribosome assembly protein 1